jgi:hypothetical protein
LAHPGAQPGRPERQPPARGLPDRRRPGSAGGERAARGQHPRSRALDPGPARTRGGPGDARAQPARRWILPPGGRRTRGWDAARPQGGRH